MQYLFFVGGTLISMSNIDPWQSFCFFSHLGGLSARYILELEWVSFWTSTLPTCKTAKNIKCWPFKEVNRFKQVIHISLHISNKWIDSECFMWTWKVSDQLLQISWELCLAKLWGLLGALCFCGSTGISLAGTWINGWTSTALGKMLQVHNKP